ncbi:MAG: FKBP-type peptidyl-prolyl cis-trans isomerase N-terminal domain-containing protein, partial [Alistipes sp.]|nr:FKBP-type peptidyl-prolyl cis-trans isomerase N-terminal domain-containing protein [Alistipes sp.]
MKRLLVVLLLVSVAACSRKGGGSVKLRTDVDSVAYILGMNIGTNLMRMDSTLNIEAVCRGIRDAAAGDTRLTMAEAQAYYLRYMNWILPEKALAYEEQFLADIAKSNRSYARTKTG